MSETFCGNAGSQHPGRRIAVGLALAVVVAAARAQAPAPPQAVDDVAALRAELLQIESLTREFEAHLQALEATRNLGTTPPPASEISASVTAPVPAAGPAVTPRPAWRQLHEGMTSDEVTALIGAPTRVFQLSGKTVWYYRYPASEVGSVFFTSASRISSVQRP